MGQGYRFRTQPVDFLLVHPVLMEEQAHPHRTGQPAGSGKAVGGHFQGTQFFPPQRVQHPGVHAVPAAQLRTAQQPAIAPAGTAPGPLGCRPLPAAQADIFDERGHFPQHLPPGHTEKQSVAGKRRQLGIGGHIRIAVDQVIPQKAVGTVVLLDFPPAAAVHSVAHGIPHRQAQQAAPVGCKLCGHR